MLGNLRILVSLTLTAAGLDLSTSDMLAERDE